MLEWGLSNLEILSPWLYWAFFKAWNHHQSQLSNNYRKQFYHLSKVTISNLTGELEDPKGLLKQYLTVINENTLYCQFLFLVTPQTPMTTIFLSCFIFMEKVH